MFKDKKNKKINLEKGKRLFFEYNGSLFDLERDLGSEYRDCNIPKEIEEQWQTEIKNDLKNGIQNEGGVDKVSAISKLMTISDLNERLNILYGVLENEELDTFSRIILCEFLKSERKNSSDVNINQMIDRVIITSKEKLLNEKMSIHKSYRNAVYMKDYDFSEENIKKRIENL